MEIKTCIGRRDWIQFRLFHQLHRPQNRYACFAWAGLPPLGLAGALFALLAHYLPGPVRFSSTWLPALLILPLYGALFFRVQERRFDQQLSRRLRACQARSLLGEFLVLLSEEGVTVSFDSESIHRPWQQIPSVLAQDDYGYIYTSPEQAIIIPRQAFPEAESFRRFIKKAIISHGNKQPVRPASSHKPVARALEWPERKLRPLPLLPA